LAIVPWLAGDDQGLEAHHHRPPRSVITKVHLPMKLLRRCRMG
jgi:hypothetical protein